MRKILFLDIDGVCNSAQFVRQNPKGGIVGIDMYCAFLVGKIQLDTGCEVVLSSTWRLWEKDREEVRSKVVDFIDCTPDFGALPRGYEIQDWLDRHPDVTRYAILDDSPDMLVGQAENFFMTRWAEGLTEEIAAAVTAHLNKPWYKHGECDTAIVEGRLEDACEGCKEHLYGAKT